MTTTDFGEPPTPPLPPQPPSAPQPSAPQPSAPQPSAPRRVLRRSRRDRVGAGVCGGLADYVGLDPVLFRVLFATAAFFGGVGIIAYLLAWAVIPEEGTERAPVDGWITQLRVRHVPFWLVAVLAGLALWIVGFSWWAPGPFFPVVAVVAILAVTIGRSNRHAPPPTEGGTDAPTVNLEKGWTPPPATPSGSPAWMQETRAWIDETRRAARERRRRALPVRLATLGTLAAALLVVGIVDLSSGVAMPVYAWVTLGVVGLGLLVGIALRRTPWSIAILLIPAFVASVALGNSQARLHDGIGQHRWEPTSSPAADYRLGLGQATLDLRSLDAQATPRTVHVVVGVGQLRIIAPSTLPMTVHAHVRLGAITVNGVEQDAGALGINRVVEPLPTARGVPITVIATVTDGALDVRRP